MKRFLACAAAVAAFVALPATPADATTLGLCDWKMTARTSNWATGIATAGPFADPTAEHGLVIECYVALASEGGEGGYLAHNRLHVPTRAAVLFDDNADISGAPMSGDVRTCTYTTNITTGVTTFRGCQITYTIEG